jgi:toxin ParE1/3/4
LGKVHYSQKAEDDLVGIGEYTLRNWGEAQAERYLDALEEYALEECCEMLGQNPRLGRSCEEIRPGLQRFEQGKHVVFYRKDADGIIVSRILHRSMLAERHDLT